MRQQLGRFGLSGNHHLQPICKLSSGQKAHTSVEGLFHDLLPTIPVVFSMQSSLKPEQMRQQLGRFGLSGHHHLQPICKLSSGQKAHTSVKRLFHDLVPTVPIVFSVQSGLKPELVRQQLGKVWVLWAPSPAAHVQAQWSP